LTKRQKAQLHRASFKEHGIPYQKARFVSDHKNPEKRKEWSECKWFEIMKLAKERNPLILLGDEVSFPRNRRKYGCEA